MKKSRKPTGPGEILREEFLAPLGLTQRQVAESLGCDVKVVNRLVNGRTSVSAGMALKLGAAFRTTPESGSTPRRWTSTKQLVASPHSRARCSRRAAAPPAGAGRRHCGDGGSSSRIAWICRRSCGRSRSTADQTSSRFKPK
ncbi:MAG: HigA family addiction module antitoxin [Vicinamibacteria bacterium]